MRILRDPHNNLATGYCIVAMSLANLLTVRVSATDRTEPFNGTVYILTVSEPENKTLDQIAHSMPWNIYGRVCQKLTNHKLVVLLNEKAKENSWNLSLFIKFILFPRNTFFGHTEVSTSSSMVVNCDNRTEKYFSQCLMKISYGVSFSM